MNVPAVPQRLAAMTAIIARNGTVSGQGNRTKINILRMSAIMPNGSRKVRSPGRRFERRWLSMTTMTPCNDALNNAELVQFIIKALSGKICMIKLTL